MSFIGAEMLLPCFSIPANCALCQRIIFLSKTDPSFFAASSNPSFFISAIFISTVSGSRPSILWCSITSSHLSLTPSCICGIFIEKSIKCPAAGGGRKEKFELPEAISCICHALAEKSSSLRLTRSPSCRSINPIIRFTFCHVAVILLHTIVNLFLQRVRQDR